MLRNSHRLILSSTPSPSVILSGTSTKFQNISRHFHVESFDKEGIEISGLSQPNGNNNVKFRNLFLRDACQSSQSIDPSTKQKTFSTGSISTSVTPEDVSIINDNVLQVKWNDGHLSSYSKNFLETYSNANSRRQYRHLAQDDLNIWDNNNGLYEMIAQVPYSSYMNSEKELARAVQSLGRNGMIFITGIPPGETLAHGGKVTVEAIAERIGYIKQTFYGPSWNVVSEFQAKNVAYTSVYLPLHMDLLYYESPPGVQLLHVIENKASGGESLFADSYSAVLDILKKDPKAYDALTKVPISYHYVNNDQHYYYSRPLIVEDVNSPIDPNSRRHAIASVNYSPPFQGPFDAFATTSDLNDLESPLVEDFHRGLKLFEEYIEDPTHQIEVKMNENTCVLFMNRRLLHGRRQFQQGTGKRWFKGTYLDIDSFYSRLRTKRDV